MLFGKNQSNSPATPDLHIPPSRPFYLRPVVWGTAAIVVAFGGATWAYSEHPEWLAGIVEEDAAGLNRLENLPEGANAEDLVFLRGEFENELAPDLIGADESEDGESQPSLLEQFMQAQEQEQSDDEPPTTFDLLDRLSANNPLLNPNGDRPAAENAPASPLAELLGTNTNNNARVSPLEEALSGNVRRTGNPLQDALNQLSQPAATTATPDSAAAPDAAGTARPLANPNGTRPNSIPGQPALPNATGGYDAFSPTRPRGQQAPTAPAPTVPLRSERRSAVTPLLAPSPSPAATGTNVPNPAAVPGQQFTSPIRQQQQLRQNNAGATNNQFRRVGGGQIESFSNPLGSSSGR